LCAPRCRLRYEERAALAQNAVGRRLLELMARKRTNLSVAADVATVEEMLELADKVRPGQAVAGQHPWVGVGVGVGVCSFVQNVERWPLVEDTLELAGTVRQQSLWVSRARRLAGVYVCVVCGWEGGHGGGGAGAGE
jgi:hypothetical protein